MDWVGRGWRGEEALGRLVWVYGALFIFIWQAIIIAIRLLTDISIDSPASIVGKIRSVIEVLYCLWLLAALWNCAFNVRWNGWGYLVRLLVLFCVLLYSFLSYTQHRPLLPQEMAGPAEVFLTKQINNVLYGYTPTSPEQQKKPNYSIKVYRN